MSGSDRMPAEWEPHAATWLTWPHCEDTWPGRLEEVLPAFLTMIRALSGSETLYVNTLDDDHREIVRAILANEGIPTGVNNAVLLLVLPTDDEWIRDYGALFIESEIGLIATDWEFNAWGRKYDRIEINNQVPAAMAEIIGASHRSFPMVLEGGAIDANGLGACLTTESCLLNPNRNPGLSRDDIVEFLHRGLGINDVIWLGAGIVGDDTDGHVDDVARFVGPSTVAAAVEEDITAANYEALADNLKRVRAHGMKDGSTLEIVELPMPAPLFHQDQRLPASYLNFYVANEVVLLPVFGDPNDDIARERLQGCFPTRQVVEIEARVLVWGFGSCHCLTQQVPRITGLRV